MRISGVGIIIDNNKRILLLKRSNYTKAFPLHWTIPGGRGDGDEKAEEIVVREIKEETGLDFKPTRLYHKGKTKHSGNDLMSNKFIGTWSGKIDIQEDEADGYAWYNYEETKKLKIAFSHRETIEKLFNDGLIK